MAKRKGLVVKVSGTAYTCVKAEVIVSDASEYDCNHPRIWLKFMRGEDAREHNRVTVMLDFQRVSMVRSQWGSVPGDDRAVYGKMDTAERWAQCYGGDIKLEKTDSVRIGDGKLMLDNENKLRLKVSKLVGEAISEYNLYHVSEDECERAALALEKLGAPIEWIYADRARGNIDGGLVDFYSVREKLHANEKHREKEQQRDSVKDPVVLWTTAPESYDSGTTRTLEVNGLQNKKGDPWRKVAVNPDEVEWHRGRYGSGLYECQENAPEAFQIKTQEVETAN